MTKAKLTDRQVAILDAARAACAEYGRTTVYRPNMTIGDRAVSNRELQQIATKLDGVSYVERSHRDTARAGHRQGWKTTTYTDGGLRFDETADRKTMTMTTNTTDTDRNPQLMATNGDASAWLNPNDGQIYIAYATPTAFLPSGMPANVHWECSETHWRSYFETVRVPAGWQACDSEGTS